MSNSKTDRSISQKMNVELARIAVYKKLAIVLILIGSCILISSFAIAQQKLTLSEAIEIAQRSSRSIKKSKLNLYGNQRSLDAQRASLKSRFALDVTPFDYNRHRSFNDLFSTWNTNEDYNSFANFSVSQPIVATNGTISLINRLGYRDNYSEFQSMKQRLVEVYFPRDKVDINFNGNDFSQVETKQKLEIISSIGQEHLVVFQCRL